MTRVVSRFLSRWPTDRLRRKSGAASPPDDAPFVVAGRTGHRRLIVALNANAERLGVRTSMAVTKAQALVPGLIIADGDPAAEVDGLTELSLWALQWISPVIMADPPDGLVLDTTRADHLHGVKAAMLADMIKLCLIQPDSAQLCAAKHLEPQSG